VSPVRAASVLVPAVGLPTCVELVPRAKGVLGLVSTTTTDSDCSERTIPTTVLYKGMCAVVAGRWNMWRKTALWGPVVRVAERPTTVCCRL
jgi:hypothetical protein